MAKQSKQEKEKAAADAKIIADQKAAIKAEKKAAAKKVADEKKAAAKLIADAKKEEKARLKAEKLAAKEANKNKPKEFTPEQIKEIEAEIKHKQRQVGNAILKKRIAKQVWRKKEIELLGK